MLQTGCWVVAEVNDDAATRREAHVVVSARVVGGRPARELPLLEDLRHRKCLWAIHQDAFEVFKKADVSRHAPCAFKTDDVFVDVITSQVAAR